MNKLLSSAVFVAVVAAIPISGTAQTAPRLIRWSSNCFTGNLPRYLVLLERVQRSDGTIIYYNIFRGNYGVPLLGTYENHDEALYDTVLRIIQATRAESIVLRPRLDYLDGCASYFAVTRGGTMQFVSELKMDYEDEAYKRLDSILAELTGAVLKFHWVKVSDDRRVAPLIFEYPNPQVP